MSYCTLQGIPLGVAFNDPVTRSDQEIGSDGVRSLSGTILRDTRGFKTNWGLKAIPYGQQDANAWRELVRGEGDHWAFDLAHLDSTEGTSFSDKGAKVITLSGGATFSSTGGVYGGQVVLTGSGQNVHFSSYTPSTGWCAGFWFNVGGTQGAYQAFGAAGITQVYLAGSPVATPSWLSISGTSLEFAHNDSSSSLSDLFIYPFAPSSSYQATWATGMDSIQAAQQWPPGGYVQTGGDLGVNTCLGTAAASDVLQMALLNGWNTAAEQLQLVLQQD